ncbi:MAG: NAD(+)/NADH kinase [Thermoleophilia bacterium]|nr:NAD(+)/NADH kinase [Thermoleophilia bacterium]
MQVLQLCRELSIEVILPQREVEKNSLEDAGSLATVVPDLMDMQVDLCVALGGDGTILRAFSRFADVGTPVLGINFGRVGFLSAIGPDAIPDGLRALLQGGHDILDLSLIEMKNGDERALAVNDIVVHKPDGGSVVRLAYSTNGIDFSPLSCDGMVLATPAGSTAYNLSNGGPLVSLSLNAMVLTAIAPHTLQFRALVLGPEESLSIRNETLGTAAAIYVDGRSAGFLESGASLNLSMASQKAHLVQPPGADFYRTLRDRFIQPTG